MVKNATNQSNGLIISATGSNCGKTTITAMLLAAFSQRKIPVQPYKIGADFFDPGMHCVYSNEVSRNLDSWIMNTDNINQIINSLPTGYRGIIEGWGGLLEHNYPDSQQASTMEIAHLLKWPIILIISCHEENEIKLDDILSNIEKAGKQNTISRIAGVILNKVNNQNQAEKLSQDLTQQGIKIFGLIQEQDSLHRPVEIHNASAECHRSCPSPKKLAAIAEQCLDINAILELTSPVIPTSEPHSIIVPKNPLKKGKKKRIAISHDDAFFFYYQDNSEFLLQHNVEILEFSPLKDKKLPNNLDGIILSGGIPENYAEQLTRNESLRKDIATHVKDGLLCYAECGGLMFLCQGIYQRDGQFYPMIGSVPGIVELTDNLQNFGYAECYTQIDNKSVSIRGHEYHYSRWLEEKKLANLWQVKTCSSHMIRTEGYKRDKIHASFVHLYFPTAEGLISEFFGLQSYR
jgi:cobyrinic acid a,c-diamide synthase